MPDLNTDHERLVRCPTGPDINELGMEGCGRSFWQKPDHEGWADCPYCGLAFNPDSPENQPPTEAPARDDQTVWRVTAADLDIRAGRALTDDELDRIGSAIGFSSVPDALDEIVFQVAGYSEGGTDA